MALEAQSQRDGGFASRLREAAVGEAVRVLREQDEARPAGRSAPCMPALSSAAHAEVRRDRAEDSSALSLDGGAVGVRTGGTRAAERRWYASRREPVHAAMPWVCHRGGLRTCASRSAEALLRVRRPGAALGKCRTICARCATTAFVRAKRTALLIGILHPGSPTA